MPRQAAPNERTRAFYIVDPSLKNVIGHYFAYDAAVAQGARDSGFQPIILAHRDVESDLAAQCGARAVFQEDIWGPPQPDSPLRRNVNKVKANLIFCATLALRLIRSRPPTGSIVFAHTFIDRQFFGLALLPLLLFWQRSTTYVYLLRYQPHFYASIVGRAAFRLIEHLAEWRSIRLATDSARLATQLSALTTLPIEVLPIPHNPIEADVASADQLRQARCRLVSLGNARDEKGIYEIFDAIRLLRDEGLADQFEFIIQCNDAAPDVAQAIAAAVAEHLPRCTMLFDKLDPSDYAQYLHDTDIVLLPYWRSIYTARTSGVFMEALSTGKPVIATRDTWMSDQLETHGAGILCADRDPEDLARAIKQAAKRLPFLAEQARQRQPHWTALHNPKALAEAVAGRNRSGAAKIPPTRVALLFPWGDFLDNQSGASRRCHLLLEFLAPKIDRFHVLHGGQTSSVWLPDGDVEALGHEGYLARGAHAVLRMVLFVATFGHAQHHEWIFWQFARLRWSRRFRRRLTRAIRSADVVLLEYPFWARQVTRIARREGRRVILTSHDLIADQITAAPWLKSRAWTLERNAYRAADALVAVAASDQAALRAAGLNALLAPNPADSRLFALDQLIEPRQICSAVFGVTLPPGPVCLFVGSNFAPNLVAVARIRDIARTMRDLDGGAATFVVAGAVAPAETSGNFMALGRIDDALLLALYAAADLILIPLPFGTGASLKTIEGMAAAKPVLGTTPAFRGLDVTPDAQVVVEDDLTAYPRQIAALMADQPLRQRLGLAAREFARLYDFRLAYRPYLELLGLRPAEDDSAEPVDLSDLLLSLARRALELKQAPLASLLAGAVLERRPSHEAAAALQQSLAGQHA